MSKVVALSIWLTCHAFEFWDKLSWWDRKFLAAGLVILFFSDHIMEIQVKWEEYAL